MQFVGNGFLKAQGYHKGQLFDPARPAESLSHLINAVFKRQFGLKVNSATYIKPATAYIQVFPNYTANSIFQNLKYTKPINCVDFFLSLDVLKLT